jgi:hypothetical protein
LVHFQIFVGSEKKPRGSVRDVKVRIHLLALAQPDARAAKRG